MLTGGTVTSVVFNTTYSISRLAYKIFLFLFSNLVKS